jgi:hypothetical protein
VATFFGLGDAGEGQTTGNAQNLIGAGLNGQDAKGKGGAPVELPVVDVNSTGAGSDGGAEKQHLFLGPNSAGGANNRGTVYGNNGYGLQEGGAPVKMPTFVVNSGLVFTAGPENSIDAYDPETGIVWCVVPAQGLEDMTPIWFGISSSAFTSARLALSLTPGTQIVNISAHGMRHFAEDARPAVMEAIKRDIANLGHIAVGKPIQRTITVGGETVTYRGIGLANNIVNIGTAFPGAAVRNIALPKGGGG